MKRPDSRPRRTSHVHWFPIASGRRVWPPCQRLIQSAASMSRYNHGLRAASKRPDGTLLERRWALSIRYGEPTLNPYVRTEFVSITDAAGACVKTAIRGYSYDKDGNVTSAREYDWVAYSSVRDAASNAL